MDGMVLNGAVLGGVVWYGDTMLDGMVNKGHLETFDILLVVPNSSALDEM